MPAGQLSVRTMASCYNCCAHSRVHSTFRTCLWLRRWTAGVTLECRSVRAERKQSLAIINARGFYPYTQWAPLAPVRNRDNTIRTTTTIINHKCSNCTIFGQLFLRKVIETDVTRCLDFSSKCTKMRLAAGLRPDPLGELTALPQTP